MVQIDPHIGGPRECKILKRAAHKWMRRAWKRGPENAPKRYEWKAYSS
jgi:hypothetical protein